MPIGKIGQILFSNFRMKADHSDRRDLFIRIAELLPVLTGRLVALGRPDRSSSTMAVSSSTTTPSTEKMLCSQVRMAAEKTTSALCWRGQIQHILTCHRILIQRRLESRGFVRHLAWVEQRAIGGAGRGCAAERSLR